MSDSIFTKLQVQAFRSGITPRSRESADWFMGQLKDMKNLNRRSLLKDSNLEAKRRPLVGSMMMFFYDPKHRKTLPYYDAFPLAIMVDRAPGGFYGLNMHYLPPKLRAVLFDNLLETTNNKRYDETTKFNINYQKLKSISKLKAFRPCFKHYLTSQVDSKIALVQPTEWEIAVFLPTQQFMKANQRTVWAQSRKASKK